MRAPMRRALLLLPLLLAACGTSRAPAPARPDPGDIAEPISCVPYARARSGIRLSGDAWEWWEAAAGRHARGSTPRPGSVLVFARTGRLRDGHLSVVARVDGSREILVDHANWASGAARGRIATGQRVVDVSPANDWSLVRVFHPPSNALGVTTWPTRGFIHADAAVAAR